MFAIATTTIFLTIKSTKLTMSPRVRPYYVCNIMIIIKLTKMIPKVITYHSILHSKLYVTRQRKKNVSMIQYRTTEI